MSALIETIPEATRLARTIASDLLVYNRQKVADGLLNDDLFERLDSEIAEGQRHFDARVGTAVRNETNFLERAVVDVLIGGSSDLPAAVW